MVRFTPTDHAKYTTKQATVTLNVIRATPTVTWPSPEPIAYGTALGDSELNAKASVPGTFVYIPGKGAVLAAGTHMPSVVFTPIDSVNYTPARAAISLSVTKATPIITWSRPASIAYGTPLSESELSATASVSGTFTYSPTKGEVLRAGEQMLSVTFTPADTVDYNAATATVMLSVTKASPTVITWPAPPEIPYGESLSYAQLNATASEPGTFTYSPSAGEVLSPGTHTLTVVFNPTDVNLSSSEAFVSLVVSKATPTITWPAQDSIPYGTPLSETQLNAYGSVPGRLVYTPAAGEVPPAGMRTLSVVFTPDQASDYTTARAEVSINVTRANPVITWPSPAPITYGTPLSEAQFNASASIPGTFVFTPAKGTVLTTGSQTLEAMFTPQDRANYATAQATVSLLVTTLTNLDSYSNIAVDPPLASPAYSTPPTRPSFEAPPMRETFDADPHSISRILQANGAVIGGHKIKNDSKSHLEETAIAAGMESRFKAPDTSSRPEPAANPSAFQGTNAIVPVIKPEERIYKGATYVKGADGQWHLKQ
jgi:hypothetical protein